MVFLFINMNRFFSISLRLCNPEVEYQCFNRIMTITIERYSSIGKQRYYKYLGGVKWSRKEFRGHKNIPQFIGVCLSYFFCYHDKQSDKKAT